MSSIACYIFSTVVLIIVCLFIIFYVSLLFAFNGFSKSSWLCLFKQLSLKKPTAKITRPNLLRNVSIKCSHSIQQGIVWNVSERELNPSFTLNYGQRFIFVVSGFLNYLQTICAISWHQQPLNKLHIAPIYEASELHKHYNRVPLKTSWNIAHPLTDNSPSDMWNCQTTSIAK